MKKILLLVATVLCAAAASAQMTSSDKMIKLDVGFGSAVGGLPIGISYEQGILDFADGAFVTVGGYVGFASSSSDYSYYKWKKSALYIAAQGNYYLAPMVDKLDLYAGLRVGYAAITSKYVYDSGNTYKYDWGSPLCYSVHVGANYWFSDSFAANLELGYGIAYANIGVAYKF